MFNTIKSQLALFGVMASAFVIALSALGMYAVRDLQTDLDITTRDASAMRNHMQGDMMHDALRADVFGAHIAAKAGDTKGLATAAKDAADHFKEFQSVMAANAQLEISAEIDAALKALDAPVKAYGSQAAALIAEMASDPTAGDRGLPTFVAKYEALEKSMAAARDQIEAQVKATQAMAEADTKKDSMLVSGLGLAAILLTAIFSVSIFRRITEPLNDLRQVVEKVNGGDMTARAKMQRTDELGQFSNAFDKLLDERIAALQVAAQENEQLNNSVISLLQTVFQLGNKDLTVRAEVTEDVIGTLSSSINQVSQATGNALSEVRSIAEHVKEASEMAALQAGRVDETAHGERQALQQMSTNLARAVGDLVKMAQLSESSNKAAEKASSATDGALRAVSATVRGMDDLRDSISETEKRFKRLGERSQEISSVVSLINTISERTHMLAMNASMQAATAGEAGRGFAVVAEEVQRLSESSRQATQQIGQLVHNIQVETNETLYTMNRLISQVVSQSEQAQQAGEQMTLTQSTTTQLVELVQQISKFSSEQSALARELQASVEKLNHGSQQTVSAITEQTRSTTTLVGYSRRLAETVSQFKLPDSLDAKTELAALPAPELAEAH